MLVGVAVVEMALATASVRGMEALHEVVAVVLQPACSARYHSVSA